MRLGRSGQLGTTRLGIGLLILGLLHVPLPEPDYHNVRHHDAPGEVCEHHDHLLRWHPDATGAQDVAIFHWHWFLPTGGPSVLPGDGPALHAHVAGWDAPTVEAPPPIVTRGPSLPVDGPIPDLGLALDILPPRDPLPASMRAGPVSARTYGATFAPHTSLSCLLGRWALLDPRRRTAVIACQSRSWARSSASPSA